MTSRIETTDETKEPAATAGATTPRTLDDAWRAVEDALPGPDWSILMGDGRDAPDYGYWATASHRDPDGHLVIVGGKRADHRPTLIAALDFLAAALTSAEPTPTEGRQPEETL